MGYLTGAGGTLYTAPSKSKVVLSFGHFQNTSANTEVVKVWLVPPTGTMRHLGRAVLLPDEGYRLLDQNEEVRMDSGYAIYGQASDDSCVEFVLTGSEYLFS